VTWRRISLAYALFHLLFNSLALGITRTVARAARLNFAPGYDKSEEKAPEFLRTGIRRSL
jgi:hypothetical protein